MEPLNKRYPKLGPATYDTMSVKPRAGQRVRISYEAEWACWDSIQRPITKRDGGSGNYLAPRDANIEIIDTPPDLDTADLEAEFFRCEGQGVNGNAAGVLLKHKPTGFVVIEGQKVSRLENMRVALLRLKELVHRGSA